MDAVPLSVGQLVDVTIASQRTTYINAEIIEIEPSERDSDFIKVRWSYHYDYDQEIDGETTMEFWVPDYQVMPATLNQFNDRPLLIIGGQVHRSAA